MGKPGSILKTIAETLLDPNNQVSTATLLQSGLYEKVLLSHFKAFRSEIPTLVGWKPLREFKYSPSQNAYTAEILLNRARTINWLEKLGNEFSDLPGILLYDAHADRDNGRKYRVYLVREGYLVYYSEDQIDDFRFTVGTIDKIFAHILKYYPGGTGDRDLMGLLGSLPNALARSSAQRQQQIEATTKVETRLRTALDDIKQ
jgi:hypothetical protein